MVNSVEKTGKTVPEAIELALQELEADKSDVTIEVLDEGSKGLLGFIGNKLCKVRVSYKETKADILYCFLRDVFEKSDVIAEINIDETEDELRADVKGDENIGMFIGRRGESMDALQYLAGLAVNKGNEDYKKVNLDIENYRKKREETLNLLAQKLANKVLKSRRNVTLEPMNPYERRLIHVALQEVKNIKTYSMGEEPHRKVIIAYERD